MRTRRPTKLYLEPLEDRLVPATVKLIAGSLYVSNPLITSGTASLKLTATGPNQFTVLDGGNNNGTYTVGGDVVLGGSVAKDTVIVDLGTNTFTGNLLILGGNGDDGIAINPTASGAAGAIRGNLTVLPGAGNDSLTINTGAGAGLTIGGSVLASDAAGKNTLKMGNGGGTTNIGGEVNVLGFADNGATSAVAIGAGKADIIGGNLTVQSSQVGSNVTVVLGAAAQGITVGKNLTVTTGAGNDTVRFFGDTLATRTSIGGDTFVDLGNGNNVFSTGVFADTTAGAIFRGNVVYRAGSGNDAISLPGTAAGSGVGTVFGGNLSVDLGGGNNDFGSIPFSGGTNGGLNSNQSVVLGNLTLNAANGNNVLDSLAIQVNGDLSITFGNGNNGTAAVPISVSRPPGGHMVWRSGNGTDVLRLRNPPVAVTSGAYVVDVLFGNGDDTFIAGDPSIGDTGSVSGRVDGGGRITANTFVQNAGWTLSPPFQLSNFP